MAQNNISGIIPSQGKKNANTKSKAQQARAVKSRAVKNTLV